MMVRSYFKEYIPFNILEGLGMKNAKSLKNQWIQVSKMYLTKEDHILILGDTKG